MKTLLGLATLAGIAVATASPASAYGHCARGYHPGRDGRCYRDVAYRPPVLVVGRYYSGHGYWDGHRYWQQRYQYHGHWRYR